MTKGRSSTRKASTSRPGGTRSRLRGRTPDALKPQPRSSSPSPNPSVPFSVLAGEGPRSPIPASTPRRRTLPEEAPEEDIIPVVKKRKTIALPTPRHQTPHSAQQPSPVHNVPVSRGSSTTGRRYLQPVDKPATLSATASQHGERAVSHVYAPTDPATGGVVDADITAASPQMPPSAMLQAALRSMQELVKAAASRSDERIAALEDRMDRCFSQYQEAIGILLRGVAYSNKDSDGKERIDLKLAPLKHIYAGLFYNRMFGMVFVKTFHGELELCASPGTLAHASEVVDRTATVLHALVFRRLLCERTARGLATSSTHVRAGNFRLELCLTMIGTAQSNSTVGVQTVTTGNGIETVPRPSWLRPGYVQTDDVKEVVRRCEDPTVKRSHMIVTPPKNTMEFETGLLWEESVERKMLVHEIVKRLHQRHVQHLNRARENVRGDFFTSLGFLWHSSMLTTYHLEVKGPIAANIRSISLTHVPDGRDTEVIRQKNLSLWKELVNHHVRDMEIIVEYEVTVFERRPFPELGRSSGERKNLVRRINFLLVALRFCTRFVASYKADDYFALHSASLQVVFAVACVFREIFIRFRESGNTLPVTDTDGTWGEDERSIHTLILDLVPSFSRTQKHILQDQVLRLSSEEFKGLHQDMAASNTNRARDYGDHILLSQDERGGDPGETIEDHHIACMKSFDFSA